MMIYLKNIFAILALYLTVGCQNPVDISVSDAWIRLPPPGSSMTAAYFKAENHTDKNFNLVAVESESFSTIEIHESVASGNTVTMKRHKNYLMMPGQAHHFAPGGKHLMLFNPPQDLRTGQSISLTLVFEEGLNLVLPFEVRKH